MLQLAQMDQVGQVRERIDLVAFISEYIPLKKAGRNFKGNCPFHSEKTPSFVVSPERQIWHCFGCQKGGDAFTFLMEYEHIEFSESLRYLAKKAGITLISKGFDNQTSSKKDVFYTLNHLSAEFYHYILTKHNAGKKALEYLLDNRKINKKLVETFKLGYAPTVGTILSTYLMNKKGYKKEDLIDSGLSSERGGRVMDFFMNRIMFPLSDHRDNILGFSGRALNDFTLPKYINTKDTLVYQKGSHFFGFNIAKDEVRKQNHVILVEGEFDVLSCFSEGFSNTIAIKGTALTESQVALISRFAQKVSLCFDMDKAGQDALKRSLPILEKYNITTTVIALPNGKDPDESIKKDPYVFKKAIKEDIHVYDYLLAKALSDFDKDLAEGKKIITDLLLPFFSQISNEIVKEHYLRKLSSELDTSYDSIIKEADKRTTKLSAPLEPVSVVKDKRSRIEILEQYLVSLIIQSEAAPTLVGQVVAILEESISKERAYQKILYQLLSYFEKSNVFDSAAFAHLLPKELVSAYDTCYLLPLPKFEVTQKYTDEVLNTARELKKLYLRSRIKQMTDTIKQKEKESENTEGLQQELSTLVTKLSS